MARPLCSPVSQGCVLTTPPVSVLFVDHSLWPKPFAYSVYLRNMGEAFE